MSQYFVHILSSRSRTLYVGVTRDLVRRLWQHRTGTVPGFTTRYGITRLGYFEATVEVRSAIAREKQIRAWRRSKKVELISRTNPAWDDPSVAWFQGADSSLRSE